MQTNNQTELRVIELVETVEGETEPFFDHTIQYRNDGGQWISLPVVRVFDRDTYEMMQGGAEAECDAAIEGAKELKAKLAKAVEHFITVNRMAENSGFISDHPICDGCCDIYHLTNSILAELKGEDRG
jgi:hypothetical protein